jgi:hypothetical protein
LTSTKHGYCILFFAFSKFPGKLKAMPRNKKQRKHRQRMNDIQEEVRINSRPVTNLSDSVDEEKNSEDFDVDSPVVELVVLDGDADWESFVEVEYVKLQWRKDAESKLKGRPAYTGNSARTQRRDRDELRDFKKTSAFTGTPSIASMFPIVIDIPVSESVSSAVAVTDEPGPVVPPIVENNYDSATTPCGMTIPQCE